MDNFETNRTKIEQEILNMTSDASQDFNEDNSVRPNKKFICGVIEGFYGRPWTTEQRKDLFRK